ncbi:hypothetical protein H6F97_11565 [Microcoleus sp. FACHB-1]|nr:hypothetical protein [Microcoleus sp. FACHB-1]
MWDGRLLPQAIPAKRGKVPLPMTAVLALLSSLAKARGRAAVDSARNDMSLEEESQGDVRKS